MQDRASARCRQRSSHWRDWPLDRSTGFAGTGFTGTGFTGTGFTGTGFTSTGPTASLPAPEAL